MASPVYHRKNRPTCNSSLLVLPFFLQSSASSKAKDVSKPPEPSSTPLLTTSVPPTKEIAWRIYDATVIREPMVVGKDKSNVWEKLMNARIVYLGEAEQVPVKDDKESELEIVNNLRKQCIECEKSICV